MSEMVLFNSWSSLLRIFLVALLIYPSLIILLRVFGKRTLSEVNMFDFIITVAYGSALASIILTSKVTFAEGALVLFMLMGLQTIVARLQSSSVFFAKWIKSDPVFLYYEGEFNDKVIKQKRFRIDDLREAVRQEGMSTFEQVEAIVLEGDGGLSVLQKSGEGSNDALYHVNKIE